MTLNELLKDLGCNMTAVFVRFNDEKPWQHFEWRVTLSRGDERFTTTYRTGTAHVAPMPRLRNARAPRPPAIQGVVASLVSDSDGADRYYRDWCSDYDRDPDSRTSLEMYLACQDAGIALRRLFRGELDRVRELSRDV